MPKFTRDELEEKTVRELRWLCADYEIQGVSKKRKDVIIDMIIEKLGEDRAATGRISAVEGFFTSQLTKPHEKPGNKTTTTIRVSCGASSGQFDVAGRKVGEVADFLREVLNVSKMASGVVNGEAVEDSYVLKPGDVLEFLKPAGKKGK